jgi:class 3 adenylate cyclase
MDCLKCGASNPAESQQCLNCGSALAEPCSSCGALVAFSSRFCSNCGARSERSREAFAEQDWEDIGAPLRLSQPLVRRVLDPRALLEGERKQITVLFADIKGSTNLIEDLGGVAVASCA